MKLSKEQTLRLISVGRKIWKTLTQDERDAYYNDNGTIGFVEDVAQILHLGLCEVTLSQFEAIHNAIIVNTK